MEKQKIPNRKNLKEQRIPGFKTYYKGILPKQYGTTIKPNQ